MNDVVDLSAMRERLLELPADPVSRSHPRNWIFRVKRTMDFVGHARHVQSEFFRKVNPYPRPFQHVKFETEDGVRIAAWYGPPHDYGAQPDTSIRPVTTVPAPDKQRKAKPGRRKRRREAKGAASQSADESSRKGAAGKATAVAGPQPRPKDASFGLSKATAPEGPQPRPKDSPFGLILVPGMFSTKDDSIHKRRAIWIWRHWKIPVVCIDMRAFGESAGIATGGWKEAFDVHAAARFLKEQGCQRVGVMAESMGGASTLNALAHDEESGAHLIDGGVLCFSAFVDLRDAVHYISSEPPKTDPFHVQWAAFRRLLRFRSAGGYERFDEYLDDAARVNGLSSFDEMADLANPKWKTSLIKTPVLLIHALDDPVVPIRHARRMERYAKDYPHIQVMTMPWGGHTGFEAREPHWFWEVLGTFFGELNGLEFPNPIEQSRRAKAQAT